MSPLGIVPWVRNVSELLPASNCPNFCNLGEQKKRTELYYQSEVESIEELAGFASELGRASASCGKPCDSEEIGLS